MGSRWLMSPPNMAWNRQMLSFQKSVSPKKRTPQCKMSQHSSTCFNHCTGLFGQTCSTGTRHTHTHARTRTNECKLVSEERVGSAHVLSGDFRRQLRNVFDAIALAPKHHSHLWEMKRSRWGGGRGGGGGGGGGGGRSEISTRQCAWTTTTAAAAASEGYLACVMEANVFVKVFRVQWRALLAMHKPRCEK